jgi:hypothetical protein
MKRWNAYNWLRARFGLARGRTHIAMFSEYMCEQVVRECKAFMENQQNYRKAG